VLLGSVAETDLRWRGLQLALVGTPVPNERMLQWSICAGSGSPAPHNCAIDGEQDDRPDGGHEDTPYEPSATYAQHGLRYEPPDEGTGDTEEDSHYDPAGVVARHDQLTQSPCDRPDYYPD